MNSYPKALVTGGAGFIGSHLVEALLSRGHQVVVIDNLANARLENLETVKNDPKLSVHVTDVTDFDGIKGLFAGVQWVFHLAALADIVPSIQQPLRYHKANVDGTASVLEAARFAGVERFLYAASSSCYGLPDVYPTPETAAIRPMYPYALSKYLAEEMVLHWAQVYGLPAVALRLFNVYGPRTRTSGTYGAVFGVFLAQKLHGKPFTIVGDGSQTRDFTFVTDVVSAFIAAADSKVRGEVFNVGSGATQSINRLVELLGGECTYIPKRAGEPDGTFADIAKITKTLAWRPSVSFETGVAAMLSHIEYWRSAPVWTESTIAEATTDWHKYMGGSR
jgi:UDP-glucose 4-epimerase